MAEVEPRRLSQQEASAFIYQYHPFKGITANTFLDFSNRWERDFVPIAKSLFSKGLKTVPDEVRQSVVQYWNEMPNRNPKIPLERKFSEDTLLRAKLIEGVNETRRRYLAFALMSVANDIQKDGENLETLAPSLFNSE